MIRGIVFGAVAFAAVFALERQFESAAQDIKRYDAMRAMSGDPPLFRQALKFAAEAFSDFAGSRAGEATDLFASFTHDIARYAAMRAM